MSKNRIQSDISFLSTMLKIDKKIIGFTMVKILKNHDEINVFTQKSLNLALEIHPTFEKSLKFKVLIWMKKT